MASREYHAEYYRTHRESQLAKESLRYRTDPEFRRRKLENARRQRAHRSIEESRAYSRNYARLHPEKNRKWVRENIEKRRSHARKYARKLCATVAGNLNRRMSESIRKALHGIGKKNKSWVELLGYDQHQLKIWLEDHFKPGMTWGALLRGAIHIDHVIPKSKFTFSSTDDVGFKRCWALDNLRPEWRRNNLSKGNKILAPSQIALGI